MELLVSIYTLKAAGLGNLSGKLLKEGGPELITCICNLWIKLP